MLNRRTLIIVVISLTCSACTIFGHEQSSEPDMDMSFNIDFSCLGICDSLNDTCLQQAEIGRNSCTGENCNEIHMDEKFKCISNKPICKSECM
jgi:hypothetical protein